MAAAALTLFPGRPDAPVNPIACFWCDPHALHDAVLNLLLFVPLGVGLGLARVPAIRAVALALGLSLVVELLQLTVIPGRDPSLRDLVTNTAGGAAGHFLGWHWRAILLPRPRLAWRLAGGARLGWVVVNLVAGWLLAPSLPEKPEWVIAGTHVGGFVDFRGRLLSWSLATRPPDSEGHGGAPRNRALAGAGVAMRPGKAIEGHVVPVLTVAEREGVFPFMLAMEGDDLLLRMRSRAGALRLMSPAARFPRAIRPWYRDLPPPVDVLVVRATRTTDRWAAVVESPSGGIVRAEVPVRTTQAWALFSPWMVHFAPGEDWGSALWCLALLVPAGYWSAAVRARRLRTAWSLAVVAAASGLAMGPIFFGQAFPGLAEGVGSAAGLAIGALLQRAASRATRPRARLPGRARRDK